MKLATLRTGSSTTAVRVEADEAVGLDAPDVGLLLADPDWPTRAAQTGGDRYQLPGAAYAPVVPRPGKIWCVGLNYRHHIREMGRELPAHPTMFAKFAEALVGATDPIVHPQDSDAMDWEAELAIVIGHSVRRASEAEAQASIAGFTVINDVTMRDWQYRTAMWLQGKTFEATTPLGPALVTPDELPGGVHPALPLSCTVDGDKVQEADTGDLVFDPVALVQYLSRIATLRPGDVIATGTPGGVGHARRPPRYLAPGTVVVTEIGGVGRLENRVIPEGGAPA